VIGLVGEQMPGRQLLEPVLRVGERVGDAPGLDEVRDRAAAGLAALPEPVRALRDPATVRPAQSPGLIALREELAWVVPQTPH
jgi:hypothetical protein